ncbi:MAG: NAD-binding protein, partial [bacterium]|nr:NAD-binding protein [bacterium]
IVGSTYLVTYNEQIFQRIQPFLARFGHEHHHHEQSKEYGAWVFGYHRIGWKIVEALRAAGTTIAAVDDDPDAIRRLREREIPGHFGDASDDEFLESLPLQGARLVVSTIPDVDTSLVLLRHLRGHLGTKVRIVVIADHIRSLDLLYHAGADFVLLPHLIGGVWASDAIIGQPWTTGTFEHLRKTQAEEMKLRTVSAAA